MLLLQTSPFSMPTVCLLLSTAILAETTSLLFSRSELCNLLQKYGVFGTGLWKYLFNTLGQGPGDGLKEWTGLIYDSCLLEQLEPDKLFQNLQDEENALLRAYANPSDVVSLALHPQIGSTSSSVRLVSIDFCDWAEFYAWMNLSLSSPLALLFHWPLTIYHILNKLLPTKGNVYVLTICAIEPQVIR